MGSVPTETVLAYLDGPGELPAALVEARRCGLAPTWSADDLVLRIPILGVSGPTANQGAPNTAIVTPEAWTEPYLIEGVFDDYRLWPPIWRFLDPRDGADIGVAAYPQPRGASVLHPAGLICAHFSRMAYAEHGGPHGNWNGKAAWQTPVEGTVAMNVSAMLARLIWEVRYNSRGRMAELPPAAAVAA